MKKLALLAAMAVMLGSMAFAEKTIELGGRAGWVCTVGTSVEGGGDVEGVTAFALGIYGHIGLVDLGPGTLAIQPELLFTLGNGYKYDYGLLGSVKYKFNTIDIPVLICYDIPIKKVSLRPFVGPQIAFPIGKAKYDGNEANSVKGFLFGATFGCGVAVPVGPVMIGGDVRYNIDFTKVKDKDSDADLLRRGGLAINFNIAYKFK